MASAPWVGLLVGSLPRGTHSRPETVIFEKACSWAWHRELGSQEGSHHSAWWERLGPSVCTNSEVHTQQLLSFWEPGMCGHGRQSVPTWLAPQKAGALSVYQACLGGTEPYELSWFAAGGTISCMTPKKGFLEPCAFAWFYLVSFHCNKPQPWILNHMRLPRKLWTWGGLGDPDILGKEEEGAGVGVKAGKLLNAHKFS